MVTNHHQLNSMILQRLNRGAKHPISIWYDNKTASASENPQKKNEANKEIKYRCSSI